MKNTNTTTHRVKLHKSKKQWIATGLTTLALAGALVVAGGQEVKADSWTANTAQSIAARINDGDKSITFEKGDTLWELGRALNIANPMDLLSQNGLKDGDQYNISVGTKITWDGNRVTVISPEGTVVSNTTIAPEQKVNPSAPVANQTTDVPSTPAPVVGSNVNTPVAEVPKANTPAVEAPKAEESKTETPKVEAPKADAPAVEAPKTETPKVDTPSVTVPTTPQVTVPTTPAPTPAPQAGESSTDLQAQVDAKAAEQTAKEAEVQQAADKVADAQAQVDAKQAEAAQSAVTRDQLVAQAAELAQRVAAAQAEVKALDYELLTMNNNDIPAYNAKLQELSFAKTRLSELEDAQSELNSRIAALPTVDTSAEDAALAQAKAEQAAKEAEAKRVADEKAALEAKLAEAKAREAEEARIAEEKRIAAEQAAKEAEEKRIAAEQAAKEAEAKRLAEEQAAREAAEKAEAERKAQAEEARRLAEEQAKKLADEKAAKEAEEKRLAEEKRIAEEKAEAERKAREAEEARIAEEKRIAEEQAEAERKAREAEERAKAAEVARTELAARLSQQAFDAINTYRQAQGLNVQSQDDVYNDAATKRSQTIAAEYAQTGDISHAGMQDDVYQTFQNAGATRDKSVSAAWSSEGIFMAGGTVTDGSTIVEAWKASPEHNKLLLDMSRQNLAVGVTIDELGRTFAAFLNTTLR